MPYRRAVSVAVRIPLLALTMLAAAESRAAAAPRCDLLFHQARVVDGTGAPWFRADVCVAGDRIAAVGQLGDMSATRRIEASGLVLAPGFIDMLGQSEYYALVDPRAASKITQGITTEITGEGQSIAPLNVRMVAAGEEGWKHYGVKPTWTTIAGYFDAFERVKPTINLGTFVGAGGVRDLVIGQDDRPATPAELEAMEVAVAQAMEDGAFGLSTSLQYVPDRFASTDEIIALAKVAARYGGSYITHQRSESYKIDDSLDEVFRIAREAKLPAQIYHLKTSCQGNWGRMPHVLERLAKARAEGLDVSADQYPWTAGQNGLDANLPLWVREGGRDKMVERLKDPAVRARIKADLAKDDPSWENQYRCAGGPSGILIASVVNSALKKYEGKTIEQIATAEGKDPVDALIDIVAADRGNTSNIIFIMNEADVKTALASPIVSLCTDSSAVAEDGILGQERSHPRAWGSAPRILGKYVRDEHVLSLEEAIRKMTSLPASRMGLADRGILRPGMLADLVAFDPATVRERSTYEDPLHYSEGIPYVAINGQLVVDGGKITAARPGRALRGPGWKVRPSRRLSYGSPRRRKILVVDDNVDALETMSLLLGKLGHEVQSGADGLAAVTLAEAFRPDLILLDIDLPGMNGLEAAMRIRALLGKAVTLVAMTGWGQAEDARRSLAAGFDRHLVKPIDLEQLQTLLKGS